MTAASQFASFVGEAYGSVHSGEGTQYNFYFQSTEQWLRDQARRRPRSVAEEDRRHLHERFVAPPGLQHARDLLRAEHTVLVRGHSGSGRRAAALMLLHELPVREGTLHELPDTTDDTAGPPLDGRDVGPGDRLLLDLSEADEARYIAVQNALSDFRSAVAANHAYLVVILPTISAISFAGTFGISWRRSPVQTPDVYSPPISGVPASVRPTLSWAVPNSPPFWPGRPCATWQRSPIASTGFGGPPLPTEAFRTGSSRPWKNSTTRPRGSRRTSPQPRTDVTERSSWRSPCSTRPPRTWFCTRRTDYWDC
ncbi:hypothetical protein ACFQ3Z_10350 [Streptomyces nogalater]